MKFEQWWKEIGMDHGLGLSRELTASAAWNKAYDVGLAEAKEICEAVARYYGTQAEGKEEPVFGHMIARESSAKSCAESINVRLLSCQAK